jgi:hypothetical protein
MINGDIIFPRNIPNLNQSLFKGAKILEFNKPKIKKIREIITDQILISPSLVKGYRAMSKNTTKKTIPKLLLELILTSSI